MPPGAPIVAEGRNANKEAGGLYRVYRLSIAFAVARRDRAGPPKVGVAKGLLDSRFRGNDGPELAVIEGPWCPLPADKLTRGVDIPPAMEKGRSGAANSPAPASHTFKNTHL